MRKIYIVILSLLSFFVFNSRLNAQSIGTYVFAPSTGTYTALSGTTTSTAAGDDGTQNVAIGFNFVFGGVTYPNAIITTNGAIKLAPDGTTGFATSWTNNLSNAYGAAIIGPAWDDNNSTGGSVVYSTTGAVGSRIFSVEWINIHMGGIGSTTTPTATFQLSLFEGTNVIRFVYGTVNPLTASSIGIGLNDLVSFLSVTPGAPATASSATANNGISAATNLTSGTTYNFFPPPPCVAPPGGGTTQSTVASACAAVAFNLTVTGASIGTGLTYLWQTSPNGLDPWASTGVTTAAYTVPTQTVATYYRRRITCSAVDGFSTALLVGQNTPSNCYCPVTFPSNVEPITLVNFNTINNATSATLNGTPPQENFTAISTNVFKGQSYPITVKGNTDGNFTTHINIYIDFNQNGDFSDAGENFYIGTIVNSTGLDATQATGNILIPPSALDGNTRMRVIKKFNTQAPPCNNAGFGQAEDYTLNIATPACVAPTGVSAGTITSNSAVVTFTSGGGTAYVEYGLAGFTPGTGATAGVGGTVITPAVSPQAIAGLAANTTYNVYVRRDCGGGIFSSNVLVSFQTLCNAIATFPYTETFEAADPTRACWKVNDYVVGTVNWIYATAGNGGTLTTAHGGTLNARFYQGNYNGNTTKLVSPTLNLSSMTNGAVVRFWYAQEVWAGDQDQLRVYYKTSAAGPWTLIPGAVYTTSVAQWTEVELTLPSSTAAAQYYVAFEGFANFGRGVLIDDVTIEAAPTCPKPTAVSALAISSNTVNINFTSPGGAFIVEYGPVGFTPGTGATAGGGTLVLGAASPITVGPPTNTLNPSTTYDFYIRRICIPGVDFSQNVKATATTLCTATNVPYTQDFTGVAVPAIPACTSVQDLNGSPTWLTVAPPPAAWGFPGNALRYLYDVAKPANDWFFIQGLNLTGGTSYQLSYKYGATDPLYPEKMKVAYGTAAHAGAMVNTLADYPSIVANSAAPFAKLERLIFTPAATGVYYIGFQVYSNPDEFQLYLDSINVKIVPLVDVGITGITLPSVNCPTNGVFVQATVKNYNLLPSNFAAYPVTVTANVTGAGTSTLTAIINTGTLAPGASMSVYLSPVFNFSVGGTYNFTVATSTNPASNDPETANDSYSTSVVVNPNPPAPAITPASAAICAGTPVLLSTQFTASPPVITWTPVTGLYTNAGATTAYLGGNAFSLYAKPAATTTYTVTAATAAGCTTSTTVTVTTNPNPVITIGSIQDTVCISDPLIPLVASPAGGTWSGTGVSGSNFVPPATAVGTYTLTYSYTNSFGCPATATKKIVVKDCPERIILLRDNALILYPNPNNGQFNIRINSVLYNNLGMRVYTNSGVLVRTQQIGGLAWGRVVPIDLSNLPGGLYMVKFTYEGGVRTSEKTFKVMIGTE